MGGSAGSSSGSSSGSGFEDLSSTYTPNPQAMAAYNQTLNMAENLAQNPYTPYTGQMIAGFTPDQMAAFQGVQNMQGYMQPYINAGTNAEQAALAYSNPANYTVQSVGQYYNPYQQSVIQSTQNLMNQQNAMQQGQLLGQANTQAGGAAFNDRTGIAQAALAGQQALANNQTLANLEQQGFQQAQQEYNQQQQQAVGANQAAAYGLGQLGTMGQQGNLGELQALLGTGGQQQQLAQQQLSGAYQQWLNAQAWPYQQTAFLADIAAGIGPSMGGTTNTVGFGSNQGQQSGSSSQASGNAGGLTSLLSMLPSMFAKDGGYIDDRSHLATGGTGTTATTGTSTSKGGLGSLLSSIASQDVGGTTSASPSTSASSDPTQLSNTGFGNIGYTPASYLDPNYQTGLNALFDPQTAAQVAESKWTSGHYDQPQQSQQQYPEPQAARHGGRIGYADGGNPNILPDLQNIYGNPLFKGFGSLIDNDTMPYSGEKLKPIQAHPTPKPDPGSMGFIPHGPRNPGSPPSPGESGGGGGGESKAEEENKNAPLDDSGGDNVTSSDGGFGVNDPADTSPILSIGPVGQSASENPVPSATLPDSPVFTSAPNDLGLTVPNASPLVDYRQNLGGFADGGGVGYANGGAPAPAMGSSGGLGNLGTYAPSDLSPLDIAPETTGINTTDPFGASHGGNKSFSDLANQWLSNHIIAEDPTPQSKGFPSMAPQTSTPQPRPELPSQEMIDTAGMTNLGNGINPGVAALFGGADPMEALMLVGSQPSGAQAGAPFGGASSSDLAAQRAQLLATPQPAAGYEEGNLDYGRMTPEGLFGMTPVGYYTEPLYAKGGRVHKESGGATSRAQQAMQYFVNRGYSPSAAAGIVGNLMHESMGLQSGIAGDYVRGRPTSFGIAQWHKDRFNNLRNYAANQGKDWRDFNTQLEFLDKELRSPDYRKAYSGVMSARTPAQAADAFVRHFERPAIDRKTGKLSGYDQRLRFANNFGAGSYQPTAYAGFQPKMAPIPGVMGGDTLLANAMANRRSPVGSRTVARDNSSLQPISGAAPSGSNLNRINPRDPSGPLLPLGNDSGVPITQRVADNAKMIAQPPAQRRGLSLSDFNPIGRAEAAEANPSESKPMFAMPKLSNFKTNDLPTALGMEWGSKKPANIPATGIVDDQSKMGLPSVNPNMYSAGQGKTFGDVFPLDAQETKSVEQDIPTPPKRPSDLSTVSKDEKTEKAPGQKYWGDWRDTEPFKSDPIGGFIDNITGDRPMADKPGNINSPMSPMAPGGFDLGHITDGMAHGGTVRRHYEDAGFVDLPDSEPDQGDQQTVANDDDFGFGQLVNPDVEQDFSPFGNEFLQKTGATISPESAAPQYAPSYVEPTRKQKSYSGDSIGSLGDLVGVIGKGLGELFGPSEAQASEQPAQRTISGDERRRYENMSPQDRAFNDIRELNNRVLTAPNKATRDAANQALKHAEWQYNILQRQQQHDEMLKFRQDALEKVYGAKQAKSEHEANPLGADYSKTGEEFIESINPAERDYVKGLISGEIEAPRSSRHFNEYMKAAAHAKPGFSPKEATLRREMYLNYLDPKGNNIGSSMVAGRAALTHAGELAQIIKEMQASGFKSINAASNWLAEQGLDKERNKLIGRYNDAVSRYSTELTKSLVPGGGTAEERSSAKENFNINKDPDALLAQLITDQNLLESSMNQKLESWENVFGKGYKLPGETGDRFQTLGESSQRAKQLVKNIISERGGDNVKASDSSRPNAPEVGSVVKGHRFKGGDPSNKANWEKVDG